MRVSWVRFSKRENLWNMRGWSSLGKARGGLSREATKVRANRKSLSLIVRNFEAIYWWAESFWGGGAEAKITFTFNTFFYWKSCWSWKLLIVPNIGFQWMRRFLKKSFLFTRLHLPLNNWQIDWRNFLAFPRRCKIVRFFAILLSTRIYPNSWQFFTSVWYHVP